MHATAPRFPLADTDDPGTLAFIGGGHMARSLIGGLVRGGGGSPAIHVADPNAQARQALEQDWPVQAFAAGADAVAGAGTWVLAVKPQVAEAVCAGLAEASRRERPLVVSIMAGIGTAALARWLPGARIVRAMPNTPALLGAGMSGLYAGADVDPAGRARARGLLAGVGATVWVEHEVEMDAVTALSGSGPAYLFLLAEAMEQAGLAQGLPAETARTLVRQTLLGAACMLAETEAEAGDLRRQVTSPGGTTAAALAVLEARGFAAGVGEAVAAAAARGAQLGGGA